MEDHGPWFELDYIKLIENIRSKNIELDFTRMGISSKRIKLNPKIPQTILNDFEMKLKNTRNSRKKLFCFRFKRNKIIYFLAKNANDINRLITKKKLFVFLQLIPNGFAAMNECVF